MQHTHSCYVLKRFSSGYKQRQQISYFAIMAPRMWNIITKEKFETHNNNIMLKLNLPGSN